MIIKEREIEVPLSEESSLYIGEKEKDPLTRLAPWGPLLFL